MRAYPVVKKFLDTVLPQLKYQEIAPLLLREFGIFPSAIILLQWLLEWAEF